MSERKIIVLANSTKPGGRCIAGIDYDTHEPVRLVSGNIRLHYVLPSDIQFYADNRKCQKLDVISVDVLEKKPIPYQKENYLINVNKKFRYEGSFSKLKLLELVSDSSNDMPATFRCPQLPRNNVNKDSICFLPVEDIDIDTYVYANGAKKKHTVIRFKYNGNYYKSGSISVTDDDKGYCNIPRHIDYAFVLFSSGEPWSFDDATDKKIYIYASGIIEMTKEEWDDCHSYYLKKSLTKELNEIIDYVKKDYGKSAYLSINKENLLLIKATNEYTGSCWKLPQKSLYKVYQLIKKHSEFRKLNIEIERTYKSQNNDNFNPVKSVCYDINFMDSNNICGKRFVHRHKGNVEVETLTKKDIFWASHDLMDTQISFE